MCIPLPTKFDGFVYIWNKLAKASYKQGIGAVSVQKIHDTRGLMCF